MASTLSARWAQWSAASAPAPIRKAPAVGHAELVRVIRDAVEAVDPVLPAGARLPDPAVSRRLHGLLLADPVKTLTSLAEETAQGDRMRMAATMAWYTLARSEEGLDLGGGEVLRVGARGPEV